MSLIVFLAVITAAALHAIWNALIKTGDDKQVGMSAIVLGHLPLALIVMPLVPSPAPESWPYILGGAGLHIGYQIFLLNSYRAGDLTQVYPIARGLAPLLVAGVSVIFLGLTLQRAEIAAIAVIALGLMSLSLVRSGEGRVNSTAVWLAIMTGCFIAAYSLVDGIGARLAGTALGFYSWLSVINAVFMVIYLMIVRPENLISKLNAGKWPLLFAGSASYAAYALVIWSFTQAPIPLVTALRETSIIFALILGVVFMKERLSLMKVVATFMILSGAAILRFVKQ